MKNLKKMTFSDAEGHFSYFQISGSKFLVFDADATTSLQQRRLTYHTVRFAQYTLLSKNKE